MTSAQPERTAPSYFQTRLERLGDGQDRFQKRRVVAISSGNYPPSSLVRTRSPNLRCWVWGLCHVRQK